MEKQLDSLLLSPRAECGSKDVKCRDTLGQGAIECNGNRLFCSWAGGFISGVVGVCVLCDGKWVPDRLWTPSEYIDNIFPHRPA